MDLDMKLKFNFNKRNRYKNICSFDTKEKAIAARKFAERKYNINSFSY